MLRNCSSESSSKRVRTTDARSFVVGEIIKQRSSRNNFRTFRCCRDQRNQCTSPLLATTIDSIEKTISELDQTDTSRETLLYSLLKKSGGGIVVNVSSTLAESAGSLTGAYNMRQSCTRICHRYDTSRSHCEQS